MRRSAMAVFAVFFAVFAGSALAQEAGVTSAPSDKDLALYRTGINPADTDVDAGEEFFNKTQGEKNTSCAACHGGAAPSKSLKGSAVMFPKWSGSAKKVVSIEDQINMCLGMMGAEKLEMKSPLMNGASLYVRSLSLGMNINVKTDGDAKETFDFGRKVFATRRGARNLSCANCHEDLVGTTLRMQPLKKIGAAAAHWPAYRMMSGQTTSLQQRFVQCMSNARLKPFPLGDYRMTALELYVTSLANGQPLATPGWVR
ncbi:MAG: sulfur oxidation c-type cytochrome SoxA [Nitrospinae bacterium]|nr:sulfur oxidation c-type cytochrome SoxA [Nitrospinota bacterium]